MNKCENCGNEYEKTFSIFLEEKEHIFDSFECAINILAPKCIHCGTRIIGHGVESNGNFFCCAHCAKSMNISGLRDNIKTDVS